MSQDGHFALIEMLFAFGVVLAIGFWQLISVRREFAKDRRKAELEKARARVDP